MGRSTWLVETHLYYQHYIRSALVYQGREGQSRSTLGTANEREGSEMIERRVGGLSFLGAKYDGTVSSGVYAQVSH